MTYEEAKQEIDKHYELLNPYILREKPGHYVVCSFVTVRNQIRLFHEGLFEAIHERRLDNKEHLTELGVIDEEMLPMVVALMWGNNVLIPLADYLAFVSRDEVKGNVS